MDKEQIYTSRSNKLLEDLFRLQQAKNGEWYPINIQLSPTNKCNLNCSFCSVANRKDLELTLDECKGLIDKFVNLHAKSIEITGGGDPTCYPYINELIEYCHNKGLSIGLITNGIKLKDTIKQENLDKLMWLRVSLNFIDQINRKVEIPNIKGTLGFSYVWNDSSTEEKINQIYHYFKDNNVKYIRVVPDCLDFRKQSELLNQVKKTIFNHIEKIVDNEEFINKIFLQTKSYEVYPHCYIGRLKPYIYTDGYVYQCSAVALYNRDFEKDWRICHWTEIDDVFPDKFKEFDTSICEEGKCFYYDQNKLLHELQMKSEHHGFI